MLPNGMFILTLLTLNMFSAYIYIYLLNVICVGKCCAVVCLAFVSQLYTSSHEFNNTYISDIEYTYTQETKIE